MDIPNDLGGDWRIDKFVDYQNAVPPIEHGTLSQYVIRNNLSERDCLMLSWYMCITYSDITSIWLHKVLPFQNISRSAQFFSSNKDKILFGSAKKYNKYNGQFESLMKQFQEKYGSDPVRKLYEVIGTGTDKQRYDNALRYNLSIKYCGRFSAELFNECCLFLSETGHFSAKMSSPNSIDWKTGSNLTSGMFNLLYKDDLANQFDKSGMTKEMESYIPLFNSTLLKIREKIWERYPQRKVDVPMFSGKICSFRNLFKCSRYAPYHADRQLEQINQYRTWYPKMSDLWDELFLIREQTIPSHFLGEKNNWTGIRKERKRLWVDRGLTGIEPESVKRSIESFFL
jgi:hypothetical protein